MLQESVKWGTTDNFDSRLNNQFYGRRILPRRNHTWLFSCQGMRIPEASECDEELHRLCKVALAALAG